MICCAVAPQILAGDLNAEPGDSALRHLIAPVAAPAPPLPVGDTADVSVRRVYDAHFVDAWLQRRAHGEGLSFSALERECRKRIDYALIRSVWNVPRGRADNASLTASCDDVAGATRRQALRVDDAALVGGAASGDERRLLAAERLVQSADQPVVFSDHKGLLFHFTLTDDTATG